MTTARIDTTRRLIHANAAAIYDAYLDPDALARWLPPAGMRCQVEVFDAHVGGAYRYRLSYDAGPDAGLGKTTADADVVSGRFLELTPARRIVHSVVFESADPQLAGEMVMAWDLAQDADGTMVTITARDVPPGIAPADHLAGFNATLDNLAAFLERA